MVKLILTVQILMSSEQSQPIRVTDLIKYSKLISFKANLPYFGWENIKL